MLPREEEVESASSSRQHAGGRCGVCEECISFTIHFFCKNTRQGVATAVGAVSVVGLVLTTILSSSLNPWLPISFMSILFGSCMGLFCCNKPAPKKPQAEMSHVHADEEFFLDPGQVRSSRRASVASRCQTPQPSLKSTTYPASVVYATEHPRTPSLCRQSSVVYQVATSGSEMTTYPVLIAAPPTYQQATCCYYDYGVV